MYTPRSTEEALEIYRKLSLIRQCEETIIREYPKDEMKTPVHSGIGLEGISVGVAHLLPPNARSFGHPRNHGQYLALTGETDKFFGELYGKVTGTGGGKAGSMHICSPEHGLITTSGIVASTISLAVGAALAAKCLGTDDLAVAMFGDAAMEAGEFWESLNFACLHQLRVLFVCEDNDLAVHTPGAERRGFSSMTDVTRGFNCHCLEGDGTDVRSVLEVVGETLALMARDPRPAFVCFKWFRFLEHVGPNTDFHVGYRAQPGAAELLALDPVYTYEQYLRSQGIDAAQLLRIRTELASQIEASVVRARTAPYPTEEDLFKGVFA